MNAATERLISWVEQGLMPDAVIRSGIRRLCEQRLTQLTVDDAAESGERTESFVQAMDRAQLAPLPQLANEQHYEVPADFFALVLGPHRKYSCGWWPTGTQTLAASEQAALDATCQRAGLADGQRVLELGCGWGSLSLWMAERYPHSLITGVSNSHSQREYIVAEARRRGLDNLEIITADMNRFEAAGGFDRIVSVEMFEHMRNWRELFARVARWLRPEGRFLMHVFCHRSTPYAFENQGPGDWMSRHFFSGGMMPSDDLALRFQDDLRLLRRWRWDGRHYQQTANAWLANLDLNRAAALPILAATYGEVAAEQWLQRWRIFFMACAELFGYRGGREWWVSHYLFENPARTATTVLPAPARP
jgi:cyclopropane-fatty-acyl-phospholipid synthase